MPAPFISSVDLAAYTRNESLDSQLASIALDAACEAVRGYVDQELAASTAATAWIDGTGAASLVLPVHPITAITALDVYTERGGTGESLVENTDYVVNYANGVLTRIDGGVFTLGRQNVSASYTYGYAVVPADARLVALQIATRIYEVGMVESESIGGLSTSYVKGAGSLTLDERHALRRYRRGV